MSKLILFRKKFQSLPIQQRKEFLSKLNKAQRFSLYLYPEFFLFDKQIITGEQRYTILRCGRSFGKTFTGSAWIARKILDGAETLGLVGPTISDVESVMVKAIIKWFPKGEAWYVGGDKKIIKFSKYPQTIVYCYSSDTEIRGPNLEYLWCDEIVKWNDKIADKVEETFATADYAVRIGKNPQTLITSTPKPFPLFFKWDKKVREGNPLYKMYTGTMFDNPFLSDSYKQAMIDEHPGREGRQEIYGDLLEDVEGAAWNQKMIDDCHLYTKDYIDIQNNKADIKDFLSIKNPVITDEQRKLSLKGELKLKPKFSLLRIVVSVDPTVSDKPDKDECGIIVAALGSDGHCYVFADRSGQYTTAQWAQESIDALRDYSASMIVIEDNNGGELVKKNILSVDPNVYVKGVKAAKGKIDRALPVSALYARGLVHHIMPTRKPNEQYINPFEKLEYQMTHFTGNPKEKSPDRLDSLTWAIYELKLSQTYVNRNVDAIPHY